MPDIITIAGSPSASSRSAKLLAYAAELLTEQNLTSTSIVVRDLPAEDLIYGRLDSPVLTGTFELLAEAKGVIVATPIYKAAYSGVLKTYLDVLPQNALAGKVVLPIATGGSPAHFLAIDYALKPVLAALGATQLLSGLYVADSQLQIGEDGRLVLQGDLAKRLEQAITSLKTTVATNFAALS